MGNCCAVLSLAEDVKKLSATMDKVTKQFDESVKKIEGIEAKIKV